MIKYKQSLLLSEKVKTSVKRIKVASELASGEPLWCATSKGKDSVVLEWLCGLAGVKFEKHYTLTSVDPPELVQFAKQDPTLHIDKPRYTSEQSEELAGQQITMWNLIPFRKFPPTRIMRYCCPEIKETFGNGYITLTGVRWAESVRRRANRSLVDTDIKKKMLKEFPDAEYELSKFENVKIMNLDNDENRRMIEQCFRTHKTLVNPIYDWQDDEVWQFIHEENIPHCELYHCGFKRLGCIGCPMGGKKGMLRDFSRYPTYKQSYIHAFDKMLKARTEPSANWQTGEDVFNWWVGL